MPKRLVLLLHVSFLVSASSLLPGERSSPIRGRYAEYRAKESSYRPVALFAKFTKCSRLLVIVEFTGIIVGTSEQHGQQPREALLGASRRCSEKGTEAASRTSCFTRSILVRSVYLSVLPVPVITESTGEHHGSCEEALSTRMIGLPSVGRPKGSETSVRAQPPEREAVRVSRNGEGRKRNNGVAECYCAKINGGWLKKTRGLGKTCLSPYLIGPRCSSHRYTG